MFACVCVCVVAVIVETNPCNHVNQIIIRVLTLGQSITECQVDAIFVYTLRYWTCDAFVIPVNCDCQIEISPLISALPLHPQTHLSKQTLQKIFRNHCIFNSPTPANTQTGNISFLFIPLSQRCNISSYSTSSIVVYFSKSEPHEFT